MHVIIIITRKWYLKIMAPTNEDWLRPCKAHTTSSRALSQEAISPFPIPYLQKKECCKHTQEAIDPSLSEGLPVCAAHSEKLAATAPPLRLKGGPPGQKVGFKLVKA
jgi:hypothetical protein